MLRSHKMLWIVAVAVLVLVSSIGLNVLLFQRSLQDYLDLNRTRLDPLGLTVYSTNAITSTASAPTVLFFGDSRAERWPPPDKAGTWNFENRGISSQTTAQVLGRFDQHVAPLRPRVVVLEAGINDLKTIPLFPDQEPAIRQRCQANISVLVQKSRDIGATVILSTIFPTGRVPLQRRLFWSDEIGVAVQAANTYLASLQAEDVILFDGAAILSDSAGQLRADYSVDELHLNAAGYAALNQELSAVLLKLAR
jgi:lysophospholipase L1-like esterase